MWMRVDDGLHAHRKTRAVTKGHPVKSRDAAPMGLWILAGSWAAQNGTDGWVPEDELDRFDSEWKPLTARLVQAGYWWPHQRAGEPGFGFNDWHDYNDPAGAASKAGTFGNHVRWHVNEKRVDPDCDHCPKEPATEDDEPETIGSIGGRSGGDSHPIGGAIADPIALPVPEPLPTRTEPDPELLLLNELSETDRFGEFWDTYGKKRGRKAAEAKWRTALKKPGINAGLLIAAADSYVTWERANNEGGRYVMDAARWLNGEHWTDERIDRARPQTRVQEHLTLVQQLAAEEAEQQQHLEIGYQR